MADCPYAKSSMTPCYLRDGDLAVGVKTGSGEEVKICIGCEFAIDLLRYADRIHPVFKKAKV